MAKLTSGASMNIYPKLHMSSDDSLHLPLPFVVSFWRQRGMYIISWRPGGMTVNQLQTAGSALAIHCGLAVTLVPTTCGGPSGAIGREKGGPRSSGKFLNFCTQKIGVIIFKH